MEGKAAWGVLLLLFFACGDPPNQDPCVGAPTFTNDIHPTIVEMKCLQCHSQTLAASARSGAPDGLDFDTFELTEPNKVAFASSITSGREPPPPAGATIGTTVAERELVEKWRMCGFPK